MKQPHFLKIPAPPYGRRFAISDVHGCLQTLEALVWQHIDLQPEDQLFFLGDYIDRGPASGGVMDFVMDLQAKGYPVYALRGNHEQMLLDDYENHDGERFKVVMTKFKKTPDLLDEFGGMNQRYLDFINGLPYYIDTEDFYLVHAGFDFGEEEPFEDWEAMLWIRQFPPRLSELQILSMLGRPKRIVHGHTPNSIGDIMHKAKNKALILPIDNGCVFGGVSRGKFTANDLGRLCALNLDTFEVLMQERLEEIV
jgi:serine/threonine protein phosphatase 1